jgi:hypothetical protein
VPLFLSVCILLMSMSLFISSIMKGTPLQSIRIMLSDFSFNQCVMGAKTKRGFWVILLTACYLFILLNTAPFEVSSCIYLTSVLYVVWRRGGHFNIILISILFPLATSIIFELMFKVPLPGGTIANWLFYSLKK